MFEAACRAFPARTERKPTAAGAGITIPMPAAKRSIRWSSASVATFARSNSLRLWSALPFSIARPVLAPSLSISTCIATMPASITPRSGIQARPRTIRSSSAWSGRLRTNASALPRSGRPRLRLGARLGSDPRPGAGRAPAPALARPPPGPETRRGAVGAAFLRSARRCPGSPDGAAAERGLGASVPRPSGVPVPRRPGASVPRPPGVPVPRRPADVLAGGVMSS